MNNLSYVAFDLETTGLYPESAQIVEIGAIRFNADGTETAVFEQLINPCCPIPPDATGIHGITDADVADKPSIDNVMPTFLDFIGSPFDTILLAHNAKFDIGFLNYYCRNAFMLSTRYIEHQVICTYDLAKRKLGRRTVNHRLGTVAAHLNVPVDVTHRALADVRLVKGIYLALRNGY